MEFVNRTPIPARLVVAQTDDPELRAGFITAKVTYRFDAAGAVTLDADDPFPIFLEDQETELGLLPRDDLERRDRVFEVICLGSAHAPEGRAVENMTVSLQVGNTKRELLVTGDRSWQGEGGDAAVTPPVPFTHMPLIWSRAFGGVAPVQIDPHTTVDVPHLNNPQGKGFDPTPATKALKQALMCPEGYPKVDYQRALPNVENPLAPVTNWDDQPEPLCWATVPTSAAMQAARSLEPPPPGPSAPEQFARSDYQPPPPSTLQVTDGAFWRAAPDWILDEAPEQGAIVLEGLTDQRRLALPLPTPFVQADYVVGADEGTLQLKPQMLVLLPDEKRFYLVLRDSFMLFFQPAQERSMRLRAELEPIAGLTDGGAP